MGGQLAAASGGLFVTGNVELRPLGPEGPTSSRGSPAGPWRHLDSLVRTCPRATLDLVRTALQIAARWCGDPRAVPWLIRSNHLAPNHWFSSRA